jgi:hypothetical protein
MNGRTRHLKRRDKENKMKLRFLIATLAFAPLTVAAQSADVRSTTQAQGQAQAGPAQARIDAAIQAAARANIPTSLLVSKVAEGRAKNVPQERIASAVEARLNSLVHASSALKRADVGVGSAAELAVSADALEAGVSESALIRVSRRAPDDRRVVAVAVLADLVRLGQSSESALARVNAAVTTSAGLANLNAEVSAQLRLGGLNSTLDAGGILRIQ